MIKANPEIGHEGEYVEKVNKFSNKSVWNH